MAQFKDETFEEKTITLDGNHYQGCTFKKCDMVFTGMGITQLQDNVFDQCQWKFDGAAARTLAFMAALYNGGAKDLIEKTFENVRSGGP